MISQPDLSMPVNFGIPSGSSPFIAIDTTQGYTIPSTLSYTPITENQICTIPPNSLPVLIQQSLQSPFLTQFQTSMTPLEIQQRESLLRCRLCADVGHTAEHCPHDIAKRIRPHDEEMNYTSNLTYSRIDDKSDNSSALTAAAFTNNTQRYESVNTSYATPLIMNSNNNNNSNNNVYNNSNNNVYNNNNNNNSVMSKGGNTSISNSTLTRTTTTTTNNYTNTTSTSPSTSITSSANNSFRNALLPIALPTTTATAAATATAAGVLSNNYFALQEAVQNNTEQPILSNYISNSNNNNNNNNNMGAAVPSTSNQYSSAAALYVLPPPPPPPPPPLPPPPSSSSLIPPPPPPFPSQPQSQPTSLTREESDLLVTNSQPLTSIICMLCGSTQHSKEDCPHRIRKLECHQCHQLGHMMMHCPMTRCYNCGSYGHSSQVCHSKPHCFHCSHSGHRSMECPMRFKGRVCYQCNEPGHEAANCPQGQLCRMCHQSGHLVAHCPAVTCHTCHVKGHTAGVCDKVKCERCKLTHTPEHCPLENNASTLPESVTPLSLTESHESHSTSAQLTEKNELPLEKSEVNNNLWDEQKSSNILDWQKHSVLLNENENMKLEPEETTLLYHNNSNNNQETDKLKEEITLEVNNCNVLTQVDHSHKENKSLEPTNDNASIQVRLNISMEELEHEESHAHVANEKEKEKEIVCPTKLISDSTNSTIDNTTNTNNGNCVKNEQTEKKVKSKLLSCAEEKEEESFSASEEEQQEQQKQQQSFLLKQKEHHAKEKEATNLMKTHSHSTSNATSASNEAHQMIEIRSSVSSANTNNSSNDNKANEVNSSSQMSNTFLINPLSSQVLLASALQEHGIVLQTESESAADLKVPLYISHNNAGDNTNDTSSSNNNNNNNAETTSVDVTSSTRSARVNPRTPRTRLGRVAVIVDGPYFEKCIRHVHDKTDIDYYRRMVLILKCTLEFIGDIFDKQPFAYWYDVDPASFMTFASNNMITSERTAALRAMELRQQYLTSEMNSGRSLPNVVARLVGRIVRREGYSSNGEPTLV